MTSTTIYHYVYRITNLIEKKHYYGKRSSKIPPKLDLGHEYFSSSTNKWFIENQKEMPFNYKYKIVSTFKNSHDALTFEIKLHNKFDVGRNQAFYNKAKQSETGYDFTGCILCIDLTTGEYVQIFDKSQLSETIIPKNRGKSLYTNGTKYKILSPDDILIKTGEFKRTNVGKCVVIIDGKHEMVTLENKKIYNYESMNKNRIAVKDSSGKKFLVYCTDERIKTGEVKIIVGSKIVLKHKITGKILAIEKGQQIPDDYEGINRGGCNNLITLIDKDNNTFRVNKNDPRIGIDLFPKS